MSIRALLASFAFVPALAVAQGTGKPSTTVTGFIATDVFKWVKKEGSYELMNIGIGTLNLDARGRYKDTSVKFKLDLDGDLSKANNIFEEALVTQEIMPWLTVSAGKGIVPFHQKHYGVINDSYVDGGTVIGSYYWNFGDQDRKYLVSMALGSNDDFVRQFFTVFADGTYQVKRNFSTGAIQKTKANSADGAMSGDKPVQVDVTAINDPMKGADPRDQRGAAYKVQFNLSREATISAGALGYWNRLDPHMSYAFVTSGKYQSPNSLEAWFELQYGASSSYRYSFENKSEILAQVGADLYFADGLSILADVEVATFAFDKVADVSGGPTLDLARSYSLKYDGTLAKAELGLATHFSDRATWTNGIAYEIGAVNAESIDSATKAKNASKALSYGRYGQSFVSTFTFAF